MDGRMRTVYSHDSNKELNSEFSEGYRVQQKQLNVVNIVTKMSIAMLRMMIMPQLRNTERYWAL